ncbi:MAG: hypothetical protein K2Y71_29110 [Xanthobacteraceae bacterium]|nr:hypothetical protein [Xanthobacteraceae bacterium]
MRWRKLGLLYSPRSEHPKLASHAANPLAILLRGDVYRVFFCGRDAQNRSSVGSVDVDIARREVVQLARDIAFAHGPEGSFYSHGVSIGNCYEADGRRYMLFMGWQNPADGHWRGDIGRLLVSPDLSLSLDGDQPFMAADHVDPVSLSYPWVIRHRGSYRMWYGSTVTWDAGNGEMLHVLNHATSDDGHRWRRHGLGVPYQLGVAQAFSRPTVIVDSHGTCHMWFSYRGGAGEKYRIGYAVSADGERWELRLDQAGIEASASGWDGEMIAYPFVFEHGGEVFMFYNGNGYGRTGFGMAVVEAQ